MQLTSFPAVTALETKLGLRAIDTDYPDMQLSRIELRRGIHEFAGTSKNNPEVMKYFSVVSLSKDAMVDETPWCAIYESWIDVKSGVICKPSTAAGDFAGQGAKIAKDQIQYGDRCVRLRTGGHHVHRFVAHADDGGYWALGGNQSNSVCIAHYTWDAVIAINRPDRSHAVAAGDPLPPIVQTQAVTVRRGDNGLQVSSLQKRLAAMGFYSGAIDGIFGSGTQGAVEAFQKHQGLSVDGIVGPKTAAALAPTDDANPVSTPNPIQPTPPNPQVPPVVVTPIPAGKIVGLDVSHWEDKTDMKQLVRAGYSFVGMKCVQGTHPQDDDSKFPLFWPAAKAAGLIRFAYGFMDATQDGAAQADYLLKHMGMPVAGDLPPCFDWERSDGQTWARQCAVALAWRNQIKARTGLKRVLFYLPLHTMHEQVFPDWIVDEIIWVVDYSASPTTVLPKPFKSWQIRQTGDKAENHGVPSGGDTNVFNGTYADLQALCVPKV